MTIDELVEKVLSGVKSEWSTLEKIRYVYIEVGKLVDKDTDFFFSVDAKLKEANLSIEEIKKIYFDDEYRGLKVICKSASNILKKVYDRLGIKSQMVETNTYISTDESIGSFDVNHWLLAIYDDDGKAIFATLTPDLPFIKMGEATQHFGSDIPYTRNYNGVIRQIYKGDEIDYKVISRDLLKDIDIKIGYIDLLYPYNDMAQNNGEYVYQYEDAANYMVRDSMKNNKMYYELEIQDTYFYKGLRCFKGQYGREINFDYTEFSSIYSEDWLLWVKNLCEMVAVRLNEDFNFNPIEEDILGKVNWSYDEWLRNTCKSIQESIFIELNDYVRDDFSDLEVSDDFNYSKWSRAIKKRFNIRNTEYQYGNLLDILDKMNSLVKFAVNPNKGEKERRRFSELFNSLAFHFIPSNHIYENNLIEMDDGDYYLSNYYIARKFFKVFPSLFNCNDVITDFNDMEYSEQVVIIKNMIETMFTEITKSNSCYMKDYNDSYDAVQNRIHIYPVKSRETGDYSIVFNIIGGEDEVDYYFFYDLKNNTFGSFDLLSMSEKYINVSDRFASRLEEEEYSEDFGFIL